jgi:hypothetical protein
VSAPNLAVLGFGEDALGEVYVIGQRVGHSVRHRELCSSSFLPIFAQTMTAMTMMMVDA